MRQLFPATRHNDSVAVASAPPTRATASSRRRRSLLIRSITSIVIIGVMATFLAGVATNHLPGFARGSATTSPVRGGSVVDVCVGDPTCIDQYFLPWRAWDTSMFGLWAPLWYGDPQGVFHPGLASEVPSPANGDVSADLTTWTFHLRPGLKWSDGSPLTADDCAFTYNLAADPAFGGWFTTATNIDGLLPFVSATAVDSTTVRLQLSRLDPGVIAFFADSTTSCIPKEIFGKMTAADAASSSENLRPTVVSGPFKIKEHVAGDHITFVRNPYYYQPGKPYLDQVTFKYYPDDTAVQSAMRTQTNVVFSGIDYSQLPGYRTIAGYTTSLSSYSTTYEVIVFNLTDPILSDHAVRQAITMSIDRNKIIQMALNGAGGLTCDDGVGTFSHQANLTCYPYDLSGANRLLESDGWAMGVDGYRRKNGQTLELEYATTEDSAAGPQRSVILPLIRDELKAIGMKIDLKVYAFDDYFGSNSGAPGVLTTGHYQIAEFNNNNFYEPNDYGMFDSASANEQNNSDVMRYANPEVDRLLADQATTADLAKRTADLHTVHADVLKDLPVMYLYTNLVISCASNNLHNFDPSPITAETWNISDWWLGSNAG